MLFFFSLCLEKFKNEILEIGFLFPHNTLAVMRPVMFPVLSGLFFLCKFLFWKRQWPNAGAQAASHQVGVAHGREDMRALEELAEQRTCMCNLEKFTITSSGCTGEKLLLLEKALKSCCYNSL